jgi:hypothetical protein
MLNDFLKTAQTALIEQLAGKTQLSSDNLESAANVVGDTFKSGLMDKFKSGDLSAITGLIGSGGNSSPLAGSLVNSTVSNLVSKLGLSKEVSNSVAKFAVPFIIEKFGQFASSKGKTGEDGVKDILGDLVGNSIKDSLIEGIGKKFGF